MNGIEAIALLVTALVVPYVVALIKNKTLTGNKARWIAIGVSVLAGVVTAFVSGIPADPIAWITCIVAAIGAVRMARRPAGHRQGQRRPAGGRQEPVHEGHRRERRKARQEEQLGQRGAPAARPAGALLRSEHG